MAKLSYGARGDEVKQLQSALNGAGFNSGEVDGIYGDMTQGAVRQYQQANGLSATGQLDEGTYNKLFNVQAAPAAQPSAPEQQAAQTGISDNTQKNLEAYQQPYQPSETVQKAQAYLQQQMDSRPGSFASPYSQQVQDAYNRLMNRGEFKYDVNADALYNQYKDLYMQQGKQAMMDTMGQAAALTGGYGSSYASTAGNQAYQQWLTRLNEIVPELEGRAYDRWQDEGDRIAQQYQMAGELEGRDYDRYRDQLGDWRDERDYAGDMYNMYYNQDYNRFGDERDYWTGQRDAEAAQAADDRDQAYKTTMLMLQNGAMPSDALLRASGLDPEDARALMNALGYGGNAGGRSGGNSGGSGGSSGGNGNESGSGNSSGSDKYDKALQQAYLTYKKNGGGLDQNMNVLVELENNAIAGKTYRDLSPQTQQFVDNMIRDEDTYVGKVKAVQRLEESGMITSRDGDYLLNKLGL